MTPNQKVLITGGAGSCGRYLTASLLAQGHEVRVIDKDVGSLQSVEDRRLTLVRAGIEDREILKSAVEGVDAVIHLAWSFSEDPLEVLEIDLKGHVHLLEEMASQKVRHLIYTSTAVVYGKPRYSPIREKHPLVVEEARKPLYGIAKAAAEKLCLMYGKTKGPPATVVRFWWAYGEEIGGKHLREMLKIASSGEPLTVPADSGGSGTGTGAMPLPSRGFRADVQFFHRLCHLGRGGGDGSGCDRLAIRNPVYSPKRVDGKRVSVGSLGAVRCRGEEPPGIPAHGARRGKGIS